MRSGLAPHGARWQDRLEQDYGVRDAAFRDPAGNLIRIQQNKEHDA